MTSTALLGGRCILYETKTRFYCVQSDPNELEYRILKIHRPHVPQQQQQRHTGTAQSLSVVEDAAVYTKPQVMDLLRMIDDGNKATGGLKRLMRIYGIIGFVRFLEGYYIYVITDAEIVAEVGGHYIYAIRDTRLISVGNASAPSSGERSSQEQRYIDVFCSVDLSKNFYFSFTYDLTHSFQHNSIGKQKNENDDGGKSKPELLQDMFVWNYYLLKQGFEEICPRSHWVLPVIHGFIQQSSMSVMGRKIVLTLIARRSRHFAGARFLKRGVNDQGFVANDVETEQIVYDASLSGFRCFPSKFSSFLQHRGSIPLFWSQDMTTMTPKPPIQINVSDPFYSAAALHFDNLFERYGTPIIALNLVKHHEKNKRESILLQEYTNAITYLNQFLPENVKIKYVAFDMSRAAKSADQDVIRILEKIAEQTIEETGFFFGDEKGAYCQSGIVRTNCIDCLDRTNAAQFIIGQCALAHQLFALELIAEPRLPLECEATKLLMEMYHDHGDTIALQYGGSALVNTMETYRKTNAWSSQSRDMIETIKRYYSNSFTDAEKQDAINLFLGNYITHHDAPTLWELDSDFYLHHRDPWIVRERPNYIRWFHESYLTLQHYVSCAKPVASTFENFYEPHHYTYFDQHFHITKAKGEEDTNLTDLYKPSPFVNQDESKSLNRPNRSFSAISIQPTDRFSLSLDPFATSPNPINRRGPQLMVPSTGALASKLLNPNVPQNEADEYERYVNQFKHPALGRISDNERIRSRSVKSPTPSINPEPTTRQPNFDDPQHYVFYDDYIQKADKLDELVYDVTKKDESIYLKYVALQDPSVAIGQFYKSNGYDGYRRWLETGRYSVQPFA